MDLLGYSPLGLSGENISELLLACCYVIESAGNFPCVEGRTMGILAQCVSEKEHLMSIRLPLEFKLAVDRGGGQDIRETSIGRAH